MSMDLQTIGIIFGLLFGFITSLNAITSILKYWEITPQHLRSLFGGTKVQESSMPEHSSKRRKLAVAIVSFVLSLAFFGYGFYLLAHRPIPPVVDGMKFTQENFTPRNSTWSSGLRVMITTESERPAVQLLIICDGDIGEAPKEGKLGKSGQFQVESQMLLASHADVWNVKWRKPMWASDDPV